MERTKFNQDLIRSITELSYFNGGNKQYDKETLSKVHNILHTLHEAELTASRNKYER